MQQNNVKVTAADITYLAKTWERSVGQSDYMTRRNACLLLFTLCQTFLRGRGIRMGSYQTLRRHGDSCARLTAEVMHRVATDEAKEIWFPRLTRLGFQSEEESWGILQGLYESEGGYMR